MSFTEIKEALPGLSVEERADLEEQLQALKEGVSVEELRSMNAAIDEALDDKSPTLSLEEVRESIRSWKPGDAP